jgi:hypothetical protein
MKVDEDDHNLLGQLYQKELNRSIKSKERIIFKECYSIHLQSSHPLEYQRHMYQKWLHRE